jgi:hypothetical protein
MIEAKTQRARGIPAARVLVADEALLLGIGKQLSVADDACRRIGCAFENANEMVRHRSFPAER